MNENINEMNEETMEFSKPDPEETPVETPTEETPVEVNDEIPVEETNDEVLVEAETETNENGEKVLFDPEAGIDEILDPGIEKQGEIPADMAKAFMGMMAGLAGENSENTENAEPAEGEQTVEDSENSNAGESGELKPDYAFDKDSEEVQGYKSNVFTRGFVDEPFVKQMSCPVCGFTEKKTLRLVAYKGIFRRKSKVVGTASICQNCGFFFLHGTNVKDMLFYLSGKGYKVNFEEQRKDGEEIK